METSLPTLVKPVLLMSRLILGGSKRSSLKLNIAFRSQTDPKRFRRSVRSNRDEYKFGRIFPASHHSLKAATTGTTFNRNRKNPEQNVDRKEELHRRVSRRRPVLQERDPPLRAHLRRHVRQHRRPRHDQGVHLDAGFKARHEGHRHRLRHRRFGTYCAVENISLLQLLMISS